MSNNFISPTLQTPEQNRASAAAENPPQEAFEGMSSESEAERLDRLGRQAAETGDIYYDEVSFVLDTVFSKATDIRHRTS
jgi:hypothetical protein